MKQLQTEGIVLSRTDYGEADRIINILTPEQGKIALMARGVRKPKSKLAGGIELFSISDISYIKGKGEIGTLISVRLKKHYANIAAVKILLLSYFTDWCSLSQPKQILPSTV